MTNLSNEMHRYESMLFDNHTTTRSEFRTPDFAPETRTIYKEKPKCYRVRPPPLKYLQSMFDWKPPKDGEPSIDIPFDLLHVKRDIVGTDPRKIQKPYEKEQDPLRAEIQKTRPRLVMTPAVSMDDIEDEAAREILIKDMYTSDMTRGNKQAVGDAVYLNVKSPFPGMPAPANPIFLPKLQAQYVSPEWRMQTVSWDNRQLRCYCDTTAEFWLKREIPFCNACKETAIIKRQRDMKYDKPR